MTDMIERVAKAIWDDACPGMVWSDLDRMNYRGWATAAIEAVRDCECTREMYEASGLLHDKVGWMRMREAWRDMFDAAITSGQLGT